MQGGVRPQELDQIPPCGKLRCWADCPGARCEITGAGRECLGSKRHREQSWCGEKVER